MKFGVFKILVAIAYPAILASLSVFVIQIIFPRLGTLAYLIAPIFASYYSIAFLRRQTVSSSFRLALAAISSTLIYCLGIPITSVAFTALVNIFVVHTGGVTILSFLYAFVILLILTAFTSSVGIALGLVYAGREGDS